MSQQLPPGHSARACWVWFNFHLGRNLRKRSFIFWALALGLLTLLAQGGLLARKPAFAELIVLVFTPLMCLFFCTGVLREEIEDKTITYGFSRPVGRSWLYLARVVAALTPVLVVLGPVILLTSAALGPEIMVRHFLGCMLAALAYGGVFALAGQLIRWPTFFGLLYVLFWELGVGQIPGFLGRMTLLAHTRGIADLPPSSRLMATLWEPPTQSAALLALVGTAVVSLYIGGALAARREPMLGQ